MYESKITKTKFQVVFVQFVDIIYICKQNSELF